ncbi:hypothetical protein B296_00044675, partial [Ensete ventricosum]
MTIVGGNEGGGRVAVAVGEDFGFGCDCWSRGLVAVREWSSDRGLQAIRKATVGRRLRQWVVATVVGDGRDDRRGGAAGSRWGRRHGKTCTARYIPVRQLTEEEEKKKKKKKKKRRSTLRRPSGDSARGSPVSRCRPRVLFSPREETERLPTRERIRGD